jgi:predicted metal-binding transcription factor (methanogenesis marker protein 9)
MKKLGKLEINPEKLIKVKELFVIRGGYGDGDCPCGHGAENWWCKVWQSGIFLFEGYACGTESYIRSIYPQS